jgi:hypothetical protein
MKWRLEVSILTVENFFEQVFNLGSKVLANSSILHWAHQVLELCEDAVVFARVELSLFLSFEKLKVKKELKEVIIALRVSLKIKVQ